MKLEQDMCFGPFRLDLVNERLWYGPQATFLPPKAFAALRYLAQQPGRLITKKELLGAVWADTYVSDAALKVCIQRLRVALGDDPHTPRFIETVYKRGYRFIADISQASAGANGSPQQARLESTPVLSPLIAASSAAIPAVIGREAEIAQLDTWLEKACQAQRQVVFVTGEAGIGKTTVVETFLKRIQSTAVQTPVWIARGQCVEHYGTGEAYLPVLEALGRLCREPGGEPLVALLSRYAPTWLVQMPWLIDDTESDRLQRKTRGVTRERMLREMAEAVEAVAASVPLVFVLEDLQWSDHSTLDLLAVLAQRLEPARLLLIGTYRPEDVLSPSHPLGTISQELGLHNHSQELPLRLLSVDEVAEYLARQFPHSPLPTSFAQRIYQATDGNPLFLVTMVDALLSQGLPSQPEGQPIVPDSETGQDLRVPESLRQMIEQQLARLSREEQQVLEAASVAGLEGAAAALAAGLEIDALQVEDLCVGLARRGRFLRASASQEWPDGTLTSRYAFIHSLYRTVVYERLPAGKCAQLHLRIGERGEVAYQGREHEIAAELALHFERGHDLCRAVRYLHQAAHNATQRFAFREAAAHVTQALTLLREEPQTPARDTTEAQLQIELGRALHFTEGAAAVETEHAYARAQELCRSTTSSVHLLYALQGLRRVQHERGELQIAHTVGLEYLDLAHQTQETESLIWAYLALGETSFLLGELDAAQTYLEQGLALPGSGDFPFIQAFMLAWLAHVLWLLGAWDQALHRIRQALVVADEYGHPYSQVSTHYFAAWLHADRQEWAVAERHLDTVVSIATRQSFSAWLAPATILRGSGLAAQGQQEAGIARMREGLNAYQANGAQVTRPYYMAMLARACTRSGQIDEGLRILAEALALVQKTGQRVYEAGFQRMYGEFLLARHTAQTRKKGDPNDVTQAERYLRVALDGARQHNAKLFELRTVLLLSQLWAQQGKKKDAIQLLAEVYERFSEGFDSVDLQNARALLDKLGERRPQKAKGLLAF